MATLANYQPGDRPGYLRQASVTLRLQSGVLARRNASLGLGVPGFTSLKNDAPGAVHAAVIETQGPPDGQALPIWLGCSETDSRLLDRRRPAPCRTGLPSPAEVG